MNIVCTHSDMCTNAHILHNIETPVGAKINKNFGTAVNASCKGNHSVCRYGDACCRFIRPGLSLKAIEGFAGDWVFLLYRCLCVTLMLTGYYAHMLTSRKYEFLLVLTHICKSVNTERLTLTSRKYKFLLVLTHICKSVNTELLTLFKTLSSKHFNFEHRYFGGFLLPCSIPMH